MTIKTAKSIKATLLFLLLSISYLDSYSQCTVKRINTSGTISYSDGSTIISERYKHLDIIFSVLKDDITGIVTSYIFSLVYSHEKAEDKFQPKRIWIKSNKLNKTLLLSVPKYDYEYDTTIQEYMYIARFEISADDAKFIRDSPISEIQLIETETDKSLQIAQNISTIQNKIKCVLSSIIR